MRLRSTLIISMAALFCATATGAWAARIKDISNVNGFEGEHLIGYGIVVGLGGTGDGSKTGFTNHSVASMMEKFGHTLDPNDIKLKNVAAVMVTAKLMPYSKKGGSLDVTVASLGDASSLEGGLLLMTPLLRQADGVQYAIAQGPLSIGGYNIDAGGGNSIRKNHSTVGRIPGGAKLQQDWKGNLIQDNRFELTLHSPDFTTVTNIVRAINAALGGETAKGLGAGRVSVWIPSHRVDDSVAFISQVENMKVGTDSPARVVINERTGTVVVGENVRIKNVAIAHGNLRVEISTTLEASQPSPYGRGESLLLPQVSAETFDETGQMAVMKPNNTVEEVARSLNELGVTPRDLIAIFQALKESGALEADLIIM
jgi:flagellar P-ring protein precursor FlgI